MEAEQVKIARTRDQHVGARMQVGGTLAEGKFEENWPDRWIRSGFSLPIWSDGVQVQWSLPKLLTAMPDYIAQHTPSTTPYWVEVVGCSGTYVTALKLQKLMRLQQWASFSDMAVTIFVYNSKYKQYIGIDLDDLVYECTVRQIEVKAHKDGPRYYHWRWADLKEIASHKGAVKR